MGLANQLYKAHKKFHRARSVTATPRRVKGKIGQTYIFLRICKVGQT